MQEVRVTCYYIDCSIYIGARDLHVGDALLRYETFPTPYDEATGKFADFCRGKQVAVLGSGNAAFEVADMVRDRDRDRETETEMPFIA